ncbi:MAG: RNA 2',3'-cyclic phosphodiesterase, partial [Blastocatellia bacterium]|nr:RNA 2',3'-cyclic phosphodiesterase [Blastocatellia bacterium]
MKIRTFICLELPNNLISRLSELQKKLALLGESVGWVKPTNIHLTLRFLGDVEAERKSEFKKTVES